MDEWKFWRGSFSEASAPRLLRKPDEAKEAVQGVDALLREPKTSAVGAELRRKGKVVSWYEHQTRYVPSSEAIASAPLLARIFQAHGKITPQEVKDLIGVAQRSEEQGGLVKIAPNQNNLMIFKIRRLREERARQK